MHLNKEKARTMNYKSKTKIRISLAINSKTGAIEYMMAIKYYLRDKMFLIKTQFSKLIN